MTQLDEVTQQLVRDWLRKAEEDRGVARELFEHNSRHLLAIGFHAQQAVEKYLKALLVARQREFPKTHDLAILIELLRNSDAAIADRLSGVIELNPFAIEGRYPGDLPEAISRSDIESALELVEETRREVLNEIT